VICFLEGGGGICALGVFGYAVILSVGFVMCGFLVWCVLLLLARSIVRVRDCHGC